MKETKIISAYPCCGKTYAFENYQDIYSILDSDSSDFSWIYRERTDDELQKIKEDFESMLSPTNADKELERIRCEKIKERNPDFPNNYIEHIKENIGKVDYIFCKYSFGCKTSFGGRRNKIFYRISRDRTA